MQLKLTETQVKKLIAANIKAAAVQPSRYGGDVTFESYEVPPEYITKLAEFARANTKEFNGILQKLAQLERVLKAPKQHKCARLDTLTEAILQACIVQSPNRWIFHTDGDVPSPWLVSGCTYTPACETRDRETPARVTLSIVASVRGDKQHRSIVFHYDDLKAKEGGGKLGMSVEELLCNAGFTFESPELTDGYNKYMEKWEKLWKQHFTQFIYSTRVVDDGGEEGDEDDDVMRQRVIESATTGVAEYKVVNDVPTLRVRQDSNTLRVPSLRRSVEEGTEDATDVFTIPVHPWLYVFNLETHSHMWVAPHKVKPYVYDKVLVDRLILPAPHKQLIRLLTSNPDTLVADFVRGKSAGTIIMATGEPGLGKTMSAEAYSEASEVILYKVQSDQLGTSPASIEKNLKEVFARTTRWGAVLLIDECDIYVRARGTDIEQNAIVGTLLRTLEYFNGIIFMTTNRATEIDDAIMSRCSAVIRYDYPTPEHMALIFEQFTKLFGVTITSSVMSEFLGGISKRPTLQEFAPQGAVLLSGRSIKNLIRLLARQGMTSPTACNMLDTMEYLAASTSTHKAGITDAELADLIVRLRSLSNG